MWLGGTIGSLKSLSNVDLNARFIFVEGNSVVTGALREECLDVCTWGYFFKTNNLELELAGQCRDDITIGITDSKSH
jgi:hypothetical protein